MRDNALYFPYISVPDNRWTIKTLLYWDKLSSIVPMDYIDEPEQLRPFMQQLVQEELVEQVIPAHHIYRIEAFEECFIQYIKPRVASLRYTQNKKAVLHNEKLNPQSRIHAEKLGQIPEFLIEEGLATRINWGWYEVDSRIANIFMAYLASCLGALEEINAAPVTNQVRFSRMFGGLNQPHKRVNSKHHDKARDVILRSLLPVPNENVTLDQLLNFKDNHGHLLPALRRRVETHCAEIAVLPNGEDRLVSTEHFITQCKDEIDEITDAMRPTWHQIAFGSITPLFGAGFTAKAASMMQEPGIADELAYAGATLTFAGCAYQAIASIRDNREAHIKKPLAYIAHAKSGLYA